MQANTVSPSPSPSPSPTTKAPTLNSNISGLKPGLGVSLKALSEKKETEKPQEEVVISGNANTPFTLEQLKKAWNEYANNISWDIHFRNSLLNCPPQNLKNNHFEVIVNNPMQEQKLMDEHIRILNFLKKKLKNSAIEMQVRITVENEKKLAYTPLEKFKLMAEENHYLLILKEKLNLEIS